MSGAIEPVVVLEVTIGLILSVETVDKSVTVELLSHDGGRKGRCAYVKKTVRLRIYGAQEIP